MKQRVFAMCVLAFGASTVGMESVASADTASIGVGETRFAQPPVIVVRDETPQPTIFVDQPHELPKDPYRSPFRLTVGPAAITSGQGIGPGLLAAADFGTGTVGVRLAAAWFRGDAADDPTSRLGTRVGIYSGELTMDFHERASPLHLVVGLGLGAVNIGKAQDVWGVAGLGRIGFEYSLGLVEADARFGASVSGGLLGPLDDTTTNAQAFATMTATFSIGF